MTAQSKYFHLNGRLCHTPTNLSTAFPCGGTDLGEVREGVFLIGSGHEEIAGEEFAGRRVDYVRTGEAAALVAVVREFNPDALSAIFPNVTTATDTSKPRLESRAFGGTATTQGTRVGASSLKVLFVPNDPKNVPAILLYNALPIPDEADRITMNQAEPAGFGVAFEAGHDSNGWNFQMGILSDLQLSPS